MKLTLKSKINGINCIAQLINMEDTIDFLLSKSRTKKAARKFFTKLLNLMEYQRKSQ